MHTSWCLCSFLGAVSSYLSLPVSHPELNPALRSGSTTQAGHQLCIHTARKFKHVWNENFKIGWLLLRVSQVRPTGPTPFLFFWEIQKLLFPLSLWCDISSNLLFLLVQFYFYLQFLPIIVYFISSLCFCHFLVWWHFDLFQTALYFNFLSQACWFMAVSFISFML